MAAAVLGLLVFAVIIYWRKTIYIYDYTNYYKKQLSLGSAFASNGFMAMRMILESLLTGDYKMFMNLFISFPFMFTTKSINAFMLSYYFTCILPVYAVLLLVARRLGQKCGVRLWGVYYGLCVLVLTAWPFLLFPATHGMPDLFGLAFAGLIFLLTADYSFEKLEWTRLICIFIATFCLILTRRWYMYFAVAYYICYSLALLLTNKNNFFLRLKNMALFGACSAVGILLPLFLTFKNVFTYDYADRYGSFYGGGFLENIKGQLVNLGWLFIVMIALGAVVCAVNRRLRGPLAVLLGTWLIGMGLFTRVQSFGLHQSLILIPVYTTLLFACFAGACALERRTLGRLGAGACGMVLAANFAAAVPANSLGGLFGAVSLDTSRRSDLMEISQLVDYILQERGEEGTAYINAIGEYASQTFSGSRLPLDLEGIMPWEYSVPSVHGFPFPLIEAKLVLIQDDPAYTNQMTVRIDEAIGQDNVFSQHYQMLSTFSFKEGPTFTVYKRMQPVDRQELEFLLGLFADYDQRWPDLFSEPVAAYAKEKGIDWNQ